MNWKRILAFGAAAIAIGATAGLATSMPARAQLGPTGPYVTTPGRHEERHPEMRRALRQLQNAQASLMSAAHDYHGHREKALDLVQRAISEVQAGISDDQH